METAVSIPDEVFQQAEERAATLGMSRDEFYTAALARLIVAEADEEIAESLDRVYADQSSALDPDLSRMQASSLGKEQW